MSVRENKSKQKLKIKYHPMTQLEKAKISHKKKKMLSRGKAKQPRKESNAISTTFEKTVKKRR